MTSVGGINGDLLAVFGPPLELDDAVNAGEKGVIGAHFDVQSGKELGPALPDDDPTGADLLAAEGFYAQTLASGVAAVGGAAL